MLDQLLRSRSAAPEGSPRIVALDIGERRTKVVIAEGGAAEGGASGMRVVSCSDEPTPPGLMSAGRMANGGELVTWMRRALVDARPGDEVWTVCPWADVQVKRLQVPDAGNREATLRGLAVNPAFRTGGGDTPAAWRQEYHVVDAGAGAVMAVAVRPEAVRTAAAAIAAAGGDPRGVSVVECAVVHAWLATAAQADARAVLLEAGHNGVTLVVMEAGEPVGFRRVMYGGRVLSERGGWFPPAEIPPPLVEEWCARIAQEVRMLLGAVFRGSAEGVPPVTFMGGLAASEELVVGLGKVLGTSVERWCGPGAADEAGDGEGGVGMRSGMRSGMEVAFGLAQQGIAHAAGLRGPQIQMLRPDDRIENRPAQARPAALAADRKVRLAAATCLLAAAACGGAEAWLRISTGQARAGVEAAQADSARVDADIARAARLEAERGRLGGATLAVEQLRRGRQGTARLMERLSLAMPAYAWADSVAVQPDDAGGASFRINGYAGTAGQVADLERAMTRPPVQEVSVLSLAPATVAGLAVVRWTLVGRVEATLPDSGESGYRSEDTAVSGEME